MSDEPMRDILLRRINDNHEAVLLELRSVQTELRDIRSEQKGIRTYIGARAGETEAMITRLFDRLNDRLDQSERSIEERLRRLEEKH